ncbi:phosphotransferase [Chitinibacter sp. ZOR0017]|uniref:phosphotransferase n=1 Tax=Chitinibacter sp. ZOR0017 TaxID=1339254 RepID=UPI0018CF0B81|nr:phosphotransferase [Chitinibacter sp. ZOR0017]
MSVPELDAALAAYAHVAQAHYQQLYSSEAQVVHAVQGFYGCAVILAGAAGEVVLKFSWQPGRVAKELRGLARLMPHATVAMPTPLWHGVLAVGERECEALLLNRLPGVAPWDVPGPWPQPERAAAAVVALLAAWHAQTDARGFEGPAGEFYPTLLPAFEAWTAPLAAYVADLHSPFTPAQRQALLALWAQRAAILAPLAGMPSSLVHDDPHAGNFLFSPSSGELLAALDPCDVAYRHREQDIFHLADVAPQLGLLEAYLAQYTPPAGFAARRWFFSLWDDVKHSQNLQWYDEAWFAVKLARYEQACADLTLAD